MASHPTQVTCRASPPPPSQWRSPVPRSCSVGLLVPLPFPQHTSCLNHLWCCVFFASTAPHMSRSTSQACSVTTWARDAFVQAEGAKVGSDVGGNVGNAVGVRDGGALGFEVGKELGSGVGSKVGSSVGLWLGVGVGSGEGSMLGDEVGAGEGSIVGRPVGSGVGEREG